MVELQQLRTYARLLPANLKGKPASTTTRVRSHSNHSLPTAGGVERTAAN